MNMVKLGIKVGNPMDFSCSEVGSRYSAEHPPQILIEQGLSNKYLWLHMLLDSAVVA